MKISNTQFVYFFPQILQLELVKTKSPYLYSLEIDLATMSDQFQKKIEHIYLLGSLRNICLTYVGAS